MLVNGHYRHERYQQFNIHDPKSRVIHKAEVKDRIIHHAVFRIIYSVFDKGFIHDSYSCRINKGTHKAVNRLENFTRNVSRQYTAPCFVLKCDISKFFYSIDHEILKQLISRRIKDEKATKLIFEIINSYYHLDNQTKRRKGVPLGNLTSQLFANIYMNEFDQFIKHELKIKRYIRYTDDFVIVHYDREYLKALIPQISKFIYNNLRLSLHLRKIIIKKFSQGVDFLGYIISPHYILLRTKTKNRLLQRIRIKKELNDNLEITNFSLNQTLQSYLGIVRHCSRRNIISSIEHILAQDCDIK